MKTRLFLLFILGFSLTLIQAQSLVLSHEGNTLEPNAEVYVQGSALEFEIIVEVDITNTSGNNIDVLVQRYENEMVPGTSSAFCWGLCFPSNVSLSPYSITIEAGTTNETDFSGHYYPAVITGTSTISYVFFDENNPNDSVMVTVHYNGMITGIGENAKLQSNAFPNPVNDLLNIEIENEVFNGEYTFALIDLTGSVVKTIVTNKSTLIINTAELAEGMYFYRITSSFEEKVLSDKIVVRH
ncbi:MAG: T9SS type A sorting domain-containing protein [Bacteroidales bacterium]|nr:T9SS type A sorting domain-containing protein [Bacteroidales bacterium]MCF8405440.1 T9SS type A sorting domain-containing protein [Bacteroidales bacterium]